MGANLDKQITDLTEKVVTNTSLSIAQENAANISNTQNIEIVGVAGDVTIDEIDLQQQIQVDVGQSMTSLSDASTQLKMADRLLQESKQVISGITIAQASYAEKNLNKWVEAIHGFSSMVAQKCASTAKQQQSVKINGVKGSLRLNRMIMSQASGIASKCVQDAALATKTLTELETDVRQTTDQMIEGLNPLAILGILAIGLLGMPVILGGAFLSNLGPLLMVAGAGLLGWSLFQKKTDIELKLFSGLYNMAAYGRIDMTARFYVSDTDDPSVDDVIALFKTQKAYAFDIDRCTRKVYMYTDPQILSVALTTQTINPLPKLVETKTNMQEGDVFHDKTKGVLVQKCGTDNFRTVVALDKTKTYALSGFTITEKNDPNSVVVVSKWPNLVNVSGWKEEYIEKPYLISGLVCLVIGFVLLITKSQEKKNNNVKESNPSAKNP